MVGFLLRFLLVYLLLMLPWPGVKSAYRRAFTTGGALVFGSYGPGGGVRFEAMDDGKHADTKLKLLHRPTQLGFFMDISSREVAYLPTVLVFSLILATPATWSRRAWGLLVGLVLIHGFVAIRLLTLILYWSNKAVAASGSTDPTLWDRTVQAGVQFVGVGQPLSYVVPIVIWMLVSVRPEHMALLSPAERAPKRPPGRDDPTTRGT